MRSFVSVFAASLMLLAVYSFSLPVNAQTTLGGGTARNTGCEPGQLCNPIKSATFGEFVKKVTAAALKVGVPIAALFIIWSGFLFVTARGSEDQLKKAKEIFLWTIVGTAVLLGASTLAVVLTETISQIGL